LLCSCIYANFQSLYSGSLYKIVYNIRRTEVRSFLCNGDPRLIASIAEHLANNFILLRSKIRRLPAVHQATLKALLEHLNRVVMHSEKNKMDPKNVAIVFGGVIFGEDEMPKGGDLLTMHTAKVINSLSTSPTLTYSE
jgi:RhoGAP domain